MKIQILPIPSPNILVVEGKITPQIAKKIDDITLKHGIVSLSGLSPNGKTAKLIYGERDPKANFELKWDILDMFKQEQNKNPKKTGFLERMKERFFPQKIKIKSCSTKKAAKLLEGQWSKDVRKA